MKKLINSCLLLICVFLAINGAKGQQVSLDNPVKAGDLTLFPDLTNNLAYYYVSDKPKLATDANGRPQFSFLRYVDNVTSAAGQPPNEEGEGGGIVHAVVSLSVTPAQLSAAQTALQMLKPGARIEGPMVYKSGHFGIVSSFRDPQGGLTRQVVGLGNAPLLDGEKAAVSMQLTKQGAKILWESFKTPAPDISFTFEMEITGYRSPKKAIIEANFDNIYLHNAFGMGLATKYLAAEIKAVYDDLMNSGAIKLVQVGDDEDLNELIRIAYNKITDMMFAPANGNGTPTLADLVALGQNTSLLDRATARINHGQTAPVNNTGTAPGTTVAAASPATGSSTPAGTSGSPAAGTGTSPATGTGTAPVATTGTAHATSAGTPPATSTGTSPTTGTPPATTTGTPPATGTGTPPATGTGTPPATGTSTPPTAATPAATSTESSTNDTSFQILATYELKAVRNHGTFRIDLNKATADNITLRFDENIGDLSAFQGDNSFFREVNLESPLYIQREIVAKIDGLNALDFGQYINYVNVRLVKTHQEGAVTNKELRIDRDNFNSQGANFKMTYGWKNDNNRRTWMNYQYETEWSFFGGTTVPGELQESRSGIITLIPPFQKRSVEFQANTEALATRGVRSVTVRLFFQLNGVEQTKEIALNPATGQLSQKIDFILPPNNFNYEYEFIWKLGNNAETPSGRLRSSSAIQFVDSM